jgi:magnesium-transporting ATPase (P-type)
VNSIASKPGAIERRKTTTNALECLHHFSCRPQPDRKRLGCRGDLRVDKSQNARRLDEAVPATTVATSITGFFFPFNGFTPALALGVLSLMVLLIASLALYRLLLGAWRRTYAITAVIAVYFNVFVLVVQLFRRAPALNALAPTQSEPPFQIAQLAVLLLFAAIGIRAAIAKPQRGLVL